MVDQEHGVGLSGADVVVVFQPEKYYNGTTWKGTYGTGTGTNVPFCIGAKITSLERNNNLEVVYSFGSREPSNIIGKQFSGTFSVEGVLSSPWAFLTALGQYTVSGGGDPYTHAFAPVNGVSSISVLNYIDMTSEPTTPVNESRVYLYTLKGCVCTSVGVSAAVGDLATCKFDFAFSNDTATASDTATMGTVNSTMGGVNSFMPFTFANGIVSWDGIVLAEVQSVDITINPNNELVYGFGSRFSKSAIAKQLEYDVNATVLFEDPNMLQLYLYKIAAGQNQSESNFAAGVSPSACYSTGVQLILTFDNSTCGVSPGAAGYKAITYTFGNCLINTESLPQSPNEMLVETLNIKPKSLLIGASNAVSVMPGLPT